MKKRYSFLFAATFAGFLSASAVEIPYSSTIADKSTKGIASDWTIVDNNADDKTWNFDGDDNNLTAVTGQPCGIKYTYHSKNAADDWAISPAFNLQAGKEYLISYWLKETSANKEAMKVFIGTDPSASALAATEPIASFNKNIGTTWRHEKILYTAPASGEYHVGFQVCSTANQYNLLLRGFFIKENIITPAAPSGLTVEIGENQALSAHLAWTLPTVDDQGEPLAGELTAVNIFRDGEQIATLPGDAVEYTDGAIPQAGAYTYAVSVSMGDVNSLCAEIRTAWIGPKTAQPLPFAENFTDPDFYTSFWTTIDIDNDAKANSNTSYPPLSNAWCFQSNLMGNATWAAIYTSRNAQIAENDWLISPPLSFPGPGKYKVSFKLAMYAGMSSGCNLSVFAGDGDQPDNMYIPVTVIKSVSSSTLNPADATVPLLEYEFETDKGGTFYIGFHAGYKATDTERRLQMGNFAVELVELYETPDPVYDVPFNSAEIEDWQPVSLLNFALTPGYYHTTFATEGDVEFTGDVLTDKEFNPDFIVIKAEEATQACFASTEVFTEFSIAEVDHTPAAPETCTYIENEDGSKTFEITCPMLNVGGTALYEITHALILNDTETVAEITGLEPGALTEYTIPASGAQTSRSAEEPSYSIVFHNLSGASEPKAVTKTVVTGIETIDADADADAVFYRLDGTRATSADIPGFYIRVSAAGAHKIIVR